MSEQRLNAVRNPDWAEGMTATELIMLYDDAEHGLCSACGRIGSHDGMCPIPFLKSALAELARLRGVVDRIERAFKHAQSRMRHGLSPAPMQFRCSHCAGLTPLLMDGFLTVWEQEVKEPTAAGEEQQDAPLGMG